MVEFAESIKKIMVPHYQPIFSLKKKKIVGFEGLSRFKIGEQLLSFPQAYQIFKEKGLDDELDWLCRKVLFEKFPFKEQKERLLFVNILFSSVKSENFGKNLTEKYVREAGLEPSQVVLEITESEKIQDTELLIELLKHYKKQGFKLALDDFGTGYNTINIFFELSYYIDFIKLPLVIIQGVSKSFVKYELLKTFREIAHSLGIKAIAEGVEKEEDLKTLIDLGVDFVQGYLVGKPLPEKEVRNFRATFKIPEKSGKAFVSSVLSWLKPIRIVEVSPEQKFKDLLYLFHNYSKNEKYLLLSLNGEIFVLNLWECARICADAMKFNLFYMRDFSWLLKEGINVCPELVKPLSQHQEQIVELCELTSPLELALIFEKSKEDVIFVKDGDEIRYYLDKEEVYEKLYREVYKARVHVNPLTGLPANVVIEEHIEELIAKGEDFFVGYFDIDNFKAFNDTYGFVSGDNLIKRTAFFLNKYIKEAYRENGFVGHIGGDDFVFVVKDNNKEKLSNTLDRLLKALEKSARIFFREDDLKKGYFVAEDREGKKRKFPLASFSVAVVRGKNKKNIQEIAKVAAQLKRIAKSHYGSKVVFE